MCVCGVYINQLQEDVNSADRIGKNREKRRYIESWKNTDREREKGRRRGWKVGKINQSSLIRPQRRRHVVPRGIQFVYHNQREKGNEFTRATGTSVGKNRHRRESERVIIDRRTYARHFLGEKKPSDEGESLVEGVSDGGGSGGRWKKKAWE